MKKRLVCLVAALVLTLGLGLSARAYTTNRELALVVDSALLLSDEQATELDARAEAITEKYDCEVVIVTVDTLDGTFVETYAQELFDDYKYGSGDERSCVMLLLAMDTRDYDLFAHGYGNTAFTDYGKDRVEESFLVYFREDDWYGGFDAYLTKCEEFLDAARAGNPVDVPVYEYEEAGFSFANVLISILIGFVPAGIVVLIMRIGMKSAVKQTAAGVYVVENSLQLTDQEDHFVRTEVHRVKREKQESSSGGTTVDSHGSSHSSGKF